MQKKEWTNAIPDSIHRKHSTDFKFILREAQQLLLHPFNGLISRTIWVSQYQKGKTSLDLNEARDDGISGCSGISWTICKQYAPRSRQITTPTLYHTIFTGWKLFLTAQPTVSRH